MDFGQFMVGIADMMENFGRKDSDKEFFAQEGENIIDLKEAIRGRMSKEDVIQAMLVESIGHSILDSGGAYGRAYQRNRQLPHYKHANSTILSGRTSERSVPEEGSYHYNTHKFHRYPYGDLTDEERQKLEEEYKAQAYLDAIQEAKDHPNDWSIDSFYHHVGKWLEDHVGDVDYELTQQFWDWVYEPEDNYEAQRYTNTTYSVEEWLRDEDEFPEQELIDTEGDYCGTVNTYNGEDMLSQTLQYIMFSVYDTLYVGMTIHGGADVRGGYGTVVIFEQEGEYALFDNAKGSIYDRTTGALWDTYDGGYSWDNHEGPHYEINLATVRALGVVTRHDFLKANVSGSKTEPKMWTRERRSRWDDRLDEPDDWCQAWIDKGWMELRYVEIEPERVEKKYQRVDGGDWQTPYKEWEYGYVPVTIPAKYAWQLFWQGEPVSEHQYDWWAWQQKLQWYDGDLKKHLREEDLRHATWQFRHRVTRLIQREGDFGAFNEIYFADDPRAHWEFWWQPMLIWQRLLVMSGGEGSWLWNFLKDRPRLRPVISRHIVSIPKPSYLWLLFKNRFLRFQMWARGGDLTRTKYMQPEQPLLDDDGVFHSPYWPNDELEGGW